MTDQTPDQTPRQPSQSDTEAADWLVRLTEIASDSESATADRQRIKDDIIQWASRSPANLRSFIEMGCVFEALGECEAELHRELVAHVDSAGNVVSVVPAGRQPAMAESSAHGVPVRVRARGSWGRTRLWARTSAIAATLIVMTVGILFGAAGTSYRTQAGEWRRIRLEDGSVAFLCEQSEIRVFFSRASRRIQLVRGHALFDVAQDVRRPLMVRTDRAEIEALGTRFDVDDRNGPTRVTVVEGAVRLNVSSNAFRPWLNLQDAFNVPSSSTQPQPSGQTLTLTKDEGAEVTGQTITQSDPSQVETAVVAQRDDLLFDNQALSIVAARINLNNRRQFRIADSAAGQKRISGRYKTDHPEGLVLAIRELYPDLDVHETDDGWVVSERRQAVASR